VRVECTNCGHLGAEFFVALVALVVAVAAALYARRSVKTADETLALARQEVGMAREQHEQFRRELRARARFKLSASVPGAGPDGVYRVDASACLLQVLVGLTNVGDRAAGPTTINLLAPRSLGENFRWSGPGGHEIPNADPARYPTTETFDHPEFGVEAVYLMRELPRVTRKTPVVGWVRISAQVPMDGETVIPMRLKAAADELPDDEDEAVLDFVVRVGRANR